MASADERRTELLVMCHEPRAGARLVAELEPHGVGADIVSDLAAARTAFFQRGGHDALVLVTDLPTRLAERAVGAMRELDPELTIIVFGHELTQLELPHGTTRIPEFHPASRAGIGAILRALATHG